MRGVNEVVPPQNKAEQTGEGEFVEVFKNAAVFVNSCLTPVPNKHCGDGGEGEVEVSLISKRRRQYRGLHTMKR